MAKKRKPKPCEWMAIMYRDHNGTPVANILMDDELMAPALFSDASTIADIKTEHMLGVVAVWYAFNIVSGEVIDLS